VLLGVAEAGFFPGIIFYLTLWFPAEYRARIVGYFMAAIPLSTVIGAPISGALLYLHGGLGLAGWQWLFIVEAVPAIILACVVFFYLTDRPADAAWLAPDERAWLTERLELEQRQRRAVRDYSVAQALVNPRVLGLSLVYFGAVATNYGLSFSCRRSSRRSVSTRLSRRWSRPRRTSSAWSAWCGGTGARTAWPSGVSTPHSRCSLRRPASLSPPRSMTPC
jgi:MFS family permease